MQVDFDCRQHADHDDGTQQFLLRGGEVHIGNPGRPIGVLGRIYPADEVRIPGKDNDEHEKADQHKIRELQNLDNNFGISGG